MLDLPVSHRGKPGEHVAQVSVGSIPWQRQLSIMV
jgi:hypothetical protein